MRCPIKRVGAEHVRDTTAVQQSARAWIPQQSLISIGITLREPVPVEYTVAERCHCACADGLFPRADRGVYTGRRIGTCFPFRCNCLLSRNSVAIGGCGGATWERKNLAFISGWTSNVAELRDTFLQGEETRNGGVRDRVGGWVSFCAASDVPVCFYENHVR